MSMESLLDAVAWRIERVLAYRAEECGVQPDGMPPPSAGQVYVAVSGGEWSSNDRGASRLDESLGVTVTISMRTALLPRDRVGQAAVRKARTGLYARAEAIRAALHMRYEVITKANELMNAIEMTAVDPASDSAVNGFVEPLKFERGGRVQSVGPAWWNNDPEDADGGDPGYTLEITMGGARRVQRIEEQA